MGVTYIQDKAIFTGEVSIEEVERLYEWMVSKEQPIINIERCSHVHTAVLQLVLALEPKIEVNSGNPLCMWLFNCWGGGSHVEKGPHS